MGIVFKGLFSEQKKKNVKGLLDILRNIFKGQIDFFKNVHSGDLVPYNFFTIFFKGLLFYRTNVFFNNIYLRTSERLSQKIFFRIFEFFFYPDVAKYPNFFKYIFSGRVI